MFMELIDTVYAVARFPFQISVPQKYVVLMELTLFLQQCLLLPFPARVEKGGGKCADQPGAEQ